MRYINRLFTYLLTYLLTYLILRSSVCMSVRACIRPSPNLWMRHCENEWADCDAHWHKWPTGQWHETINFGARSKSRSDKAEDIFRPGGGIVLEPLGSTMFSSLNFGAVWLSGNALVSINVVTLRRVWLVHGWVTVFGRVNYLGMLPATQIKSAWPSLRG